MAKPHNDEFQEQLTRFLKRTFAGVKWDDSVEETAGRWMKAMAEFSPVDEPNFKLTVFPTQVSQLITCLNIEFASLCAHHLFPFSGVAHVGYIPNKKMIGLSKIPRVVHYHATKPQTQETLTREIASMLKNTLEAQGVAVVIEGRHTCMSCRGIKQRNGIMMTSEMRGVFLSAEAARIEFLQMIEMGRLK